MNLVSASSSFYKIFSLHFPPGEHQMELLDYVAAKFHEEAGIFKLLVQAFKYCCLKELFSVLFFFYWFQSKFTSFHFQMLIYFYFNPVQIIDSIMALFRVDFSGRGELAERQQKLAQMLSRLQKISEGRFLK